MNVISIEEAIKRDGIILFAPTGYSMQPFIIAGRDIVTVQKKEDSKRCRRMQAILFKRDDGTYVLHRILKIRPKDYWVVGDNSTWGEFVSDKQVLGTVIAVRRNGKNINAQSKKYTITIYIWYIIWWIRYIAVHIKKKSRTFLAVLNRRR